MSTNPGYASVPLRFPQNRQARQQLVPSFANAPQVPHPQLHLQAVPSADVTEPIDVPVPVVTPSGTSDHQPLTGTATPHGLALYVAIDEATITAAGATLIELTRDVQAHVKTLVPAASIYAAVALAPADAPGSDIDVVRITRGDPTVSRYPRPDIPPSPSQALPPGPVGVFIDLSRREVHLDGETLNLTLKEFDLFSYLVKNHARTVTREELLSGLWRNADVTPNARAIDLHIRRLRCKLGRMATIVRSERGHGYRFYGHPEVVIRAAPEYCI